MWKYLKPYLPFAALTVFFMLGDAGADLVQPMLMASIVDEGILSAEGGLERVAQIGVSMALVAVGGGVAGSLCNLFAQLATQKTGNLIRQTCFERVMNLSFAQVERLGTGTLITRLTNDISQVQALLAMFMRMMVRMLLFVVGSTTLLFTLDARFGYIALVACPLMAIIIVTCMRKANPLFAKLQTRIDAINSIMQEDIAGLRTIKAYVHESFEKLRFGRANDELVKTQLSTLVIFAFMNPLVSSVAYIAIACMLAAGHHDVAIGATTPGNVMAALSYALLLLQGTMMIVLLSQNISRGLVSWRRVKELLAIEPDQKNGTITQGREGTPAVELRRVTFSYPDAAHPALQNVSLTVNHGETIAIMGATGCGKTALVSLIPRFYDASEGEVLVEGVEVRDWDATALRDRVAFALQKSELFSVNVHDNIAWGRPEAAREQVEEAARIAQALDFVSELEEGFDTPVAERGMSLSGGQRQRIALARMALSEADIIILDDATSALDLRTEAQLHEALSAAKPDATKIIVAQRIASALLADRIVMMDAGNIVDAGTHEELLARCELYRTVYDSQLGEEAGKVSETEAVAQEAVTSEAAPGASASKTAQGGECRG